MRDGGGKKTALIEIVACGTLSGRCGHASSNPQKVALADCGVARQADTAMHNLNESLGSAAERFVFAIDQNQVARNANIFQFDDPEQPRGELRHRVGSSLEANADAGSSKPFDQFI